MKRFHTYDVVNIRMMAADAAFTKVDGAVVQKRDTYDVGMGIVLDGHMNPDIDNWIYQVAVISDRFDPHRNDLGELWVNDFELEKGE
ncbi:MAG: hypothetical protein IT445_06310 [Phycisphaeraceae bacterium]|nr:hypothetical protein [Phycisphaeraceae bacterium]